MRIMWLSITEYEDTGVIVIEAGYADSDSKIFGIGIGGGRDMAEIYIDTGSTRHQIMVSEDEVIDALLDLAANIADSHVLAEDYWEYEV